MSLDALHDATLNCVKLDWQSGEVLLEVSTHEGPKKIMFENVIGLDVPRKHPWGPSRSINEVRDKPEVCEIEMQSGDVIVIRKNQQSE